jgi:hypothetical protein
MKARLSSFIFNHVLLNDETPGRHTVTLSNLQFPLVEDLHVFFESTKIQEIKRELKGIHK